VVVPSLARKVMVNVEFSARPDGIAVTAKEVALQGRERRD
jgi:hypothetical protein